MSLGFRIPHPWIPDSISGRIPDFKILFWIPDAISWTPDSKAVDSGLHRPKLLGFWITSHGVTSSIFVGGPCSSSQASPAAPESLYRSFLAAT